ncbi:MAG TPA: serine hydrolase domain-containing protein [Thermoanaerobaculia bacterium]
MTRALLAVVLILGHFPAAAATKRRAVQHPAPPVTPAAIVSAARQAAEGALAAGVPAVQIAVSHRGRVIYSEAFGVTDKVTSTAATPRSVMQIASITKPFVAAAILRLADRGALSLDDPIEKHVPEFKPRAVTITLRHLLTHTSGLNTPLPDVYSPYTRAQYMAAVNAQPLQFTPGSKWVYSNGAYKMLGFVIESISGMTLADYIHTEIALPLGLIDTGVCGTYGLPVPDGYAMQEGTMKRTPAVDMSVAFAAGALCSTASDLSRWSYLLATGRVMLAASYATMITPATLSDNSVTSYGLGVTLEKMLGQPTVSHTGASPGFQSSLIYFSNQEIAVAVIINAMPPPPGVGAHIIALSVAGAALGAL